MTSIAQEFSPRYQSFGADAVVVDVSGLSRLFGTSRAIADAMAEDAARRGVRVHIAIAATCTAARVLAHARPGVTVVAKDREAAVLAPLALGILDKSWVGAELVSAPERAWPFSQWGLKTLGELAALPSADLSARLGPRALRLQALARGLDVTPLVPDLKEERFDGSLELEWPIEGLEPLSFVLTRLLEPLSVRLERRDRGAAVLHVQLGLVNDEVHARRLELPSPIRDVRTLRSLALIDLESHPPAAAIDRVAIVIDPTPGRVLQHMLWTRAHPTPERISTLLARLGALMGQDRIGAPAVVDSHRPGAFHMQAFAVDHEKPQRGAHRDRRDQDVQNVSASSAGSALGLFSALRRCRTPVPARVAVAHDRPVRVTTDRRGYDGGAVLQCAGPWRTSGEWWAGEAGQAGRAGKFLPSWNRDEWDVALADGAVYRIFQDRDTKSWFIDAVVD